MKITQRQKDALRQLQARLSSIGLTDHIAEVRNDKYCLIKQNMIIAQDKDYEKMWRIFTMYLRKMINA